MANFTNFNSSNQNKPLCAFRTPSYLPTNDELMKAYVKRNKLWNGMSDKQSINKFIKLINFPPHIHPNLYDACELDEIENIKNGTIEPPCPDIRDFLDHDVQIRIGYKKI